MPGKDTSHGAPGRMGFLASLDRATLPLQMLIARRSAPDPATLGHPRFSDRIKDRSLRWKIEGQPNPYRPIASKHEGQDYMRSLGYPVPEVYGVFPSIDDIPRFEDLPRSFVLKPTHGWSAKGVFLMRDGLDLASGRHLTRDELIHAARTYRGAAVEALAGSWIAEEYIQNFEAEDGPTVDYKFFCFGPKVAVIQVNRRTTRVDPAYDHWILDTNWRRLPVRLRWVNYPQRRVLPRPPCLDEMLRIVSDVGGRLNIFVRIDMYATRRGPVFGEFSAYPHFGRGYTPRGDAWLGSHWTTQEGGAEGPDTPRSFALSFSPTDKSLIYR